MPCNQRKRNDLIPLLRGEREIRFFYATLFISVGVTDFVIPTGAALFAAERRDLGSSLLGATTVFPA